MTRTTDTTDTTDPIEAVAQAMHEAAGSGDLPSLATCRVLARDAVTALTALGAALPDEAAKLRADLKRATARERMANQHAHRCDADVAESDARAKRLAADLATIEAVHARHRATWYEERDALREQVADALAPCTQTRPDSVIGTSDTERLKAVRERLAMPNRPESAQEVAK